MGRGQNKSPAYPLGGELRGRLKHTNIACNVGVQTAKDNVTFEKLARLALLDDEVAHRAHWGGLLPLDGIAVLLACRLGRGADGNELEERVVLQQEDEALANGAGGAEDTCMKNSQCQLKEAKQYKILKSGARG